MQEEIIVENGIKSILQKIFDYYYSYKRTCKTVALGGLFTSLKLFPFMERGSVSDLNTATNNGYYNLTGSVSNFPIENMWTTMLVIGGAYKIQVVFNVTNDISELYIRKYYLSDNTFTKWKIFT